MADQGLVKAHALGGTYGITEAAVDIWEYAQANPDSPTHYFPPLGSLNLQINAPVTGSNILSPGATVHYTETNDRAPIARAISEIRDAIHKAALPDEDKEAALRDIGSLRDEVEKGNPNPTILRALWTSVEAHAPGVVENLSDVGRAVAAVTKLIGGLG